MRRLLLLAVLLALARRGGARDHPLAIALHAQAAPTSTIVVGSVLTTAGLGAALRERADVRLVEIFYPFEYGGLSAEPTTRSFLPAACIAAISLSTASAESGL